jgi:hypothetical protein
MTAQHKKIRATNVAKVAGKGRRQVKDAGDNDATTIDATPGNKTNNKRTTTRLNIQQQD